MSLSPWKLGRATGHRAVTPCYVQHVAVCKEQSILGKDKTRLNCRSSSTTKRPGTQPGSRDRGREGSRDWGREGSREVFPPRLCLPLLPASLFSCYRTFSLLFSPQEKMPPANSPFLSLQGTSWLRGAGDFPEPMSGPREGGQWTQLGAEAALDSLSRDSWWHRFL